MRLEDLTPEQREKVKACKTVEDAMALAKDEGVELTADQLEQIAGGGAWDASSKGPIAYDCVCPHCGARTTLTEEQYKTQSEYRCRGCGKTVHI